jgi:hypothetical protein
MRASVGAILALGCLALGSGCVVRRGPGNEPVSELRSEVDSFTPRTAPVDAAVIAAALAKLDAVSNAYLQEAVDWANSEPDCNSHCMAMLVSETLASTQPRGEVKKKLTDIRNGSPYQRWGRIPTVPGWRGFKGEIEHLLSKGKTTDGRHAIDEGVMHLPLDGSVFKDIGRLDSPGSFLEVGAILPIDLAPGVPRLFIGSDKFGHFLSTGFEYLEAYLETYDESVAKGLSPDEAHERAEFAMYVRGLLTEVTSLGGWIARVFSYADLSANHAGFLFFKDIFDRKSPYLRQDEATGKWSLTQTRFSWRSFVAASWDEALNCSHYFSSVGGGNNFQKKIVHELWELGERHGQRFECPVDPPTCTAMAQTYEAKFGKAALPALLSPQCLEIVQGQRAPLVFTEVDANRSDDELAALGFYSGEHVVKQSRSWCRAQRDALVAQRCAAHPLPGVSAGDCPKRIERVTSERFRCEMDLRDFLGWSF